MSATATKTTKNSQIIVPPMEQRPVESLPGVDEAHEYLLEAGWSETSRNERGDRFYSDPAGNGDKAGVKQKTVELPGKDGTDPVVVTQMVCPPAPWAYPLHEAMNIQRSRDTASKKAVA